jgi:hypothetical protein
LGGSAHNGGPRDQQGEVIRFPRSKWVPEDGIEPLNGDAEDQHSPEGGAVAELDPGQSGADQRSSWPAIEASDFWASGDAQEFVGVAPMARASTPPADRHDGISEAVVGDGPADRPVSHADQAWGGGEPGKRHSRAPLLTALVVVTLMPRGAWRCGGCLVPSHAVPNRPLPRSRRTTQLRQRITSPPNAPRRQSPVGHTLEERTRSAGGRRAVSESRPREFPPHRPLQPRWRTDPASRRIHSLRIKAPKRLFTQAARRPVAQTAAGALARALLPPAPRSSLHSRHSASTAPWDR